MRNKMLSVMLLVSGVLMLCALGLCLRQIDGQANRPDPHQITDKAENNGKCYVQVWIEVTPEEYIGLDIGDEFREGDK